MFDLEYYNQITDFGKLYDDFVNSSRKIRCMGGDNAYSRNKNQRKAKIMKETEYYMNELVGFLTIHNEYYEWYDNYYNKESLIKKTNKHFKNNEDEICIFDKPFKGSDLYKQQF